MQHNNLTANPWFYLLRLGLHARRGLLSDYVAVAWVYDGEHGDTEVLAAGSPEVVVGAQIGVHAGLSEHGVVLHFALAERRRVVADDHQFALSVAQRLEGLFVAQHALAALHHEAQPRVDGLHGLL